MSTSTLKDPVRPVSKFSQPRLDSQKGPQHRSDPVLGELPITTRFLVHCDTVAFRFQHMFKLPELTMEANINYCMFYEKNMETIPKWTFIFHVYINHIIFEQHMWRCPHGNVTADAVPWHPPSGPLMATSRYLVERFAASALRSTRPLRWGVVVSFCAGGSWFSGFAALEEFPTEP